MTLYFINYKLPLVFSEMLIPFYDVELAHLQIYRSSVILFKCRQFLMKNNSRKAHHVFLDFFMSS